MLYQFLGGRKVQARGLGFIAILFFLMASYAPALADCGVNVACRVVDGLGHNVGGGAGRGLREEMQPLVDRVIEQQLPVLIAQFQRAVDRNIMTAAEAANDILRTVRSVAQDTLRDARRNTEQVIAGAEAKFQQAQRDFFADFDRRLVTAFEKLNCTLAGGDARLREQQELFWKEANSLFSLPRFGRTQVNACHAEAGITRTDQPLGPISSFRLYKCARLSAIDTGDASATRIRDAYAEVERRAYDALCASHGSSTSTRVFSEEWVDAGWRAVAWQRALDGK